MPQLSIQEAVEQALLQGMESDSSVMLLAEAVDAEQQLQKFAGRIFEAPPGAALGISAGLAAAGFRPVCETDFEGLKHMNGPAGNALPAVAVAPYGGHHENFPEHFASHAHAANAKVIVPSSPLNAKGLMSAAMRESGPVVFFHPEHPIHNKEHIPDGSYTLDIGKANIVKEGNDVTLVSWGTGVKMCHEVAEKLPAQFDAEVIDLLTLCPLDMETIAKSLNKTGRLVVAHEAPAPSAFSSEIIARACDSSFHNLQAPPARVWGGDEKCLEEAVRRAMEF